MNSPRPSLTAALSASLERMVAIQMRAYPDCWSAADKRELAERQLFGDRK